MIRLLRNPISWFVVALLIMTARNWLYFAEGATVGRRARFLDALMLAFIASCWVSRDRKGKTSWQTDLTMIFYGIAFPVYLIVTRKWKGALWLALIVVGCALTIILPAWILDTDA